MVIPFPALKDRDRECRMRLSRAAAFRLVAQGFSMPAPDQVPAMRAALMDMDRPLKDGLWEPVVARRVRAVRRAWFGAAPAMVMAEYLRLFHGNPVVSVHETAYGDGRRFNGRPVEMADINGYYRAFGFTGHPDNPDLPDHIGAECEFASLLLVKESYAITHGWVLRHAVTGEALAGFLEDHLGRWVGAFRRALRRADASPCWQSLAALAAALVESECRIRRVRPAAVATMAPPDEMQAEEFICPREEVAVPWPTAPSAP